LTTEKFLVNAVDIIYVTVVRFQVNSRKFSALLRNQPALGFDQPLTECTKLIIFSGMKRPGCEAIHSSYSTKVKNKWSYTFTTKQHITARCLIKHFLHKIPIALNVFSVSIICIHKRCHYWNVYFLFIICIHNRCHYWNVYSLLVICIHNRCHYWYVYSLLSFY